MISNVFNLIKKIFLLIMLCISLFPTFSSAQTLDDSDNLFYLEYIASYPDLINSFGADPVQGMNHYNTYGADENRTKSFNACEYIASNADLVNWLGSDLVGGVTFYINYGKDQARVTTFSGYQYLLANPDVMQLVGSNTDAACLHYITKGRFDGHPTTPGKKLIGFNNKCLTSGGSTPTQGSQVVLWDCVGNVAQQQWTLSSNGSVIGSGGYCLTPNYWSLNNGSPLIMWPCDSSAVTQKWHLNDQGNLVSAADNNKCVDIAGMNSTNGTSAWVYDCWGGSNQLWQPASGLTLVGLNGKCLDAGTASISAVENSQSTLYSCNNSPQQQWVFDRGQIKGLGGLCLSMANKQVYSGAPLVMNVCSDDAGATGQHWFIKNDLTISSSDNANLCINVLSANTFDGAPIAAYTCTPGAANNNWQQQ